MWRRACAAAACLLIVSTAVFAQNVAVDTIETTTFKFSLPPVEVFQLAIGQTTVNKEPG